MYPDYSCAILHSSSDIENQILLVAPCAGCVEASRKDEENKIDWKWGRCSTPNFADAQLIQTSPELYISLKKCWKFINDDGTCRVCKAVTKFDPELNKDIIKHKSTCWYQNVLNKAIGNE